MNQPLRVYTESETIVTMVDGFIFSWNHIQILMELQVYVERATVKVRDEHGIEFYISVGLLNLDRNLLRMINPPV